LSDGGKIAITDLASPTW